MRAIVNSFNILTLCLISSSVFAQEAKRFVSFMYNFQSINSSITNEQCENLFKSPTYYQIDNDKVIYEKNSDYTISNYERTGVTFLNKNTYLFTGTANYNFDFDGKKQTTTEEKAFVLKIKEKMIKGSFIIKGFCKGNFIGTEVTTHQWPIEKLN